MEDKKILGVQIIGWTVLTSNALLLIFSYFISLVDKPPVIQYLISIVAITAVFPLDFFCSYLREAGLVHILWILAMAFFSIGLLQLSQLARKIFIIFNVIHIVFLSTMTFSRAGSHQFLDYFFVWYFNLVVSGTYVGWITTTEMREQFGKFSKWEMFFKKLRFKSIDKANAQAHYNLGVAYGRLRRYEDAVVSLQKALRLNPQNSDFHFQIGMIFMQQKEYGKAVAAFKEAVRIDPNQAKAIYQLGLAYKKEGCDQEAIAVLEKSTQVHPDHVESYFHLGKACMSSGRLHEALHAFDKAVQLNPQNHVVHYHLGLVYFQLGRHKEAREVLRKSIQLNSSVVDVHFQLGLVCIKLTHYKEAIRAFKEALRLDADNRQAHYQLGFAYTLIKDFDSARRECHVLKSLDSDLANNLGMFIGS